MSIWISFLTESSAVNNYAHRPVVNFEFILYNVCTINHVRVGLFYSILKRTLV